MTEKGLYALDRPRVIARSVSDAAISMPWRRGYLARIVGRTAYDIP
jgi:hypothetical protein